MALASSWIYTVGVLIFARGMISAGLEGMPRRVYRAQATYDNAAWDLGGMLTGIGGTLMFVGILLFFVVIGLTVLVGKKGEAPAGHPVVGDAPRALAARLGAEARSAEAVDAGGGGADPHRLRALLRQLPAPAPHLAGLFALVDRRAADTRTAGHGPGGVGGG